MSTVIKVENLGKKYLISSQKRERYATLRDTIAQTALKLFNPFSKRDEIRSKYEEFWALKDVSFEINQGDRIGIIGRNGAGKSTLLKLLSRITEPTTGRISIKGRVASLLEVGTGFHTELTGRENIYLNGAVLGMTRAEIKKKFDEIVDFAEVEKFLDTPVKRYSSGMYMRLAFAVAAYLEPEILIVDEVLAVGDAEFQKKCLGKMEEVGKEGRTVLFVSHNMAAIEALCEKVLLLESGVLVKKGEAVTIIGEYLLSMIKTSQEKICLGKTKNIISITTKNSKGLTTDKFFTGDNIIFEIELFYETFLEYPRLSIEIGNLTGQTLVTIHTDIQQNKKWSFEGKKIIKAIWKNNRMVPCKYRINVDFWGYSNQIECLPGCANIEILPKDVYGTGQLPDSNIQGYLLADVEWEV